MAYNKAIDTDVSPMNLLPPKWSDTVNHFTRYTPDIEIETPFRLIQDISGFTAGVPNAGRLVAQVRSNMPFTMLEWALDGGTYSPLAADGVIDIDIDQAGVHALTVRYNWRLSPSEYTRWYRKVEFRIVDMNQWGVRYSLPFDAQYYDANTEQPVLRKYRVQFLIRGYDDTAEEIVGGTEPITIQYTDGSGEDLLAPICASKADIVLKQQYAGQYDDLFNANHMDVQVRLVTGTNTILWRGYMTNESFDYGNVEFPTEVTFIAKDGLAFLKDLPVGYRINGNVYPYNRLCSVHDLIYSMMRELQLNDTYYIAVIPYHDPTITDSNNGLRALNVDLAQWTKPGNMYELLAGLLQSYGLRISQYQRGWLVEFIGEQEGYVAGCSVLFDFMRLQESNTSLPLNKYEIGRKSAPGADGVIQVLNDSMYQLIRERNVRMTQPWKWNMRREWLIEKAKNEFEGSVININLAKQQLDFSAGFYEVIDYPFLEDTGLESGPGFPYLTSGTSDGEIQYEALKNVVGFWEGSASTVSTYPTSFAGLLGHVKRFKFPEIDNPLAQIRFKLSFETWSERQGAAGEQLLWVSFFYGGNFHKNSWTPIDPNVFVSSGITSFSQSFVLPADNSYKTHSVLTGVLSRDQILDDQLQVRFWRPIQSPQEVFPIFIRKVKVEAFIEIPITAVTSDIADTEGVDESVYWIADNLELYEREQLLIDPSTYGGASAGNEMLNSVGERLEVVRDRRTAVDFAMRDVIFNQVVKFNGIKQKSFSTSLQARQINFGQRALFEGRELITTSLEWRVRNSLYTARYRVVPEIDILSSDYENVLVVDFGSTETLVAIKVQLQMSSGTGDVTRIFNGSGTTLNVSDVLSTIDAGAISGIGVASYKLVDVSALPDLIAIRLDGGNFADVKDRYIAVSKWSNKLTRIELLDLPNLSSVAAIPAEVTTLVVNGCNLSSAAVNTLLARLVTNGLPNGTVNLSGQTPPAPPTGFGIDHVYTLVESGWTVITD